jgi:hypothetical protein
MVELDDIEILLIAQESEARPYFINKKQKKNGQTKHEFGGKRKPTCMERI